MPTIRSKYSDYYRVATYIDPEGNMAQQEFKAECDINNIMKKYQRTGTIDHLNKYQGAYMDVQVQDYQEALNIINQIEPMFADLPSSVRDKFDNDPAAFLDYVQENGQDGVVQIMKDLAIEVAPLKGMTGSNGEPANLPADSQE